MNSGAALSGGGSGPAAPVANFSLDAQHVPLGDLQFFTDLSTGMPTSWKWYVNGSLISQSQFPPGFYCGGIGIYLVQLTVANAFGSNTSAVQTFYVP